MMPMINQPDTQEQKPQSEKLVLPAPLAEEQQMYYGGQKAQLRPEQLIRHQTQSAPKDVGTRLAFYWHKDPAYKVLMIAITMVLIAGIVFVSLASAAFLGNSSFVASTSSTPQAIPKGSNPTGTVNLRPTFPAPGGGSGTNQQSSQPPVQSTPALQPTSTGQPGPTPGGGGTFTVQFTSIPSHIMNGSYVSVGVNTSEPGVSVLLVIRYSGGRTTTAGPQMTDSNGNASIPWFVFAYGNGQRNLQAYVYALATDQNGQKAKSETVTVQIR
jgi:hypothetical protein